MIIQWRSMVRLKYIENFVEISLRGICHRWQTTRNVKSRESYYIVEQDDDIYKDNGEPSDNETFMQQFCKHF